MIYLRQSKFFWRPNIFLDFAPELGDAIMLRHISIIMSKTCPIISSLVKPLSFENEIKDTGS